MTGDPPRGYVGPAEQADADGRDRWPDADDADDLAARDNAEP